MFQTAYKWYFKDSSLCFCKTRRAQRHPFYLPRTDQECDMTLKVPGVLYAVKCTDMHRYRQTVGGWAPATECMNSTWHHRSSLPTSQWGEGLRISFNLEIICLCNVHTMNILKPKPHIRAQLTWGSLTEVPCSPQPNILLQSLTPWSLTPFSLIVFSTGRYHRVNLEVCQWLCHLFLCVLDFLTKFQCFSSMNGVNHVRENRYFKLPFYDFGNWDSVKLNSMTKAQS